MKSILDLKEPLKVPSWRDDDDWKCGCGEAEKLDKHAAEVGENHYERVKSAQDNLETAQRERDAAQARAYLGGKTDIGPFHVRVHEAQEALAAARNEPEARKRAARIFRHEILPERAAKAVQAEAVALNERRRKLMPRLRKAALEFMEINRLMADLDMQMKIDFDWNAAEVRSTTYEELLPHLHVSVGDRPFEAAFEVWTKAGV